MRLIDDPAFWEAATAEPAVDVPFRPDVVAEFLAAVHKSLQANTWPGNVSAANPALFLLDGIQFTFAPGAEIWTQSVEHFAGFIERARERRRRACSHEDERCACDSVRHIVWESLSSTDPSPYSWARLTEAERERWFARIFELAGRYLDLGPGHNPAVARLVGLAAHDPDELLIAPLSSAPGAPPAHPRLHQQQGHPAAA